MPIGRATPLEDILEKDWQRDVLTLAKQLGWRVYHTFNSQRSAHGFPDAVLVRDRVVYIEFKRETTRPTEDQKAWIRDLLNAGAECYIARPHDLDGLGLILSSRKLGQLVNERASYAAASLREQTRKEVAG